MDLSENGDLQQVLPLDVAIERVARQRRVQRRKEAGSKPAPVPEPAGKQILITITEASRTLGIGRRQAFEMVWRGELPVVRLGPRTVRVARAVLDQFVLERSRPYGS